MTLTADLCHTAAQARRLPRTHPDYAALHARLDQLLYRWERERTLRPSQVLAKQG
jgi:hypothetical protein